VKNFIFADAAGSLPSLLGDEVLQAMPHGDQQGDQHHIHPREAEGDQLLYDHPEHVHEHSDHPHSDNIHDHYQHGNEVHHDNLDDYKQDESVVVVGIQGDYTEELMQYVSTFDHIIFSHIRNCS
jgi:hypothetical protein